MKFFRQIANIIQKDHFGVLWFSLFYLGILLAKWMYIHPVIRESDNCYICVVLILTACAAIVTFIVALLWELWSGTISKGVLFLFLLSMAILGCAYVMDILTQKLFNQLYYNGYLNWQEVDLGFLFDDFLHHSVGLYLASLMIYSMFRAAISSEFIDRKFVVPVSLILLVMSSSLLVIGLFLY